MAHLLPRDRPADIVVRLGALGGQAARGVGARRYPASAGARSLQAVV
ncbi:MAG: hypothetical protein ABJL49_05265 [Parasphingorhabdus sp.]